MLKYIAAITFCLMPLLAQAKIIETEKFSDILQEADANTLVLFDIDDTMIHTTVTLGSTPWWNYFLTKGEQMGVSVSENTPQMNQIIEKIIRRVPIEANEKDTVATIKQLKAKGVMTLGLTARHNNPCFMPEADKAILAELAKLGIDFSQTKLPKEPTEAVNKMFRDGIIFTNHELKGPYLQTFLSEMGLQPNKIVFIDDSLKHLLSVEQTIDAAHIPYVGIHYRYVVNNHPKFNPLIGNIQLEYLLERDQLLSDAEAENIAQTMKHPDPDYYVNKLIKNCL